MKTIATIVVALGPLLLCAQESDDNLHLLVEQLIDQQDLDIGYDELYENLLLYRSSPIDLNSASHDQLRMLGILSEMQIQNLVDHRARNGNLLSVYELQTISSFDATAIAHLEPFVTVNAAFTTLPFWHRVRKYSQVIVRTEASIEPREGFRTLNPDLKFPGSPFKSLVRYRSSHSNDFSMGLTLEQDAGEALAVAPADHRFGTDFLSGHFQKSNVGKFKNVLVGDYQLQVAQGLILGGAFGGGKGGETVSGIRKSTLGAIPVTSAAESNYLRGAATAYRVGSQLEFVPYYSQTLRDATLAINHDGSASASSFGGSGLHRNRHELKSRKTLREIQYGGILVGSHSHLDWGLITAHIRFSHPISPSPSPYNQFHFHGDRNTTTGVFLNYTRFNFTYFGELARNISGGVGWIGGVLGSLSSRMDIALLHRSYSRNYHSFYTNALAESGTPQNERGLYWGLKYAFSRRIVAAGYFDLFEFPWLRFNGYQPSAGYEWLGKINFQPSRSTTLSAQFKEEAKDRNQRADQGAYQVSSGIKRSLVVTLDLSHERVLTLKTRLQASRYSREGTVTSGIALAQDVTLDIGNIKLSGRYSIFDCDDFDNRLYLIEKDVGYVGSFPSFTGAGIRAMMMIQANAGKHLTLWLRYAHTRVEGVDHLGTGMDETAGNERNDIKLQARVTF